MKIGLNSVTSLDPGHWSGVPLFCESQQSLSIVATS